MSKPDIDYLCGIHVMGWKLSNGVEMYSDGQWYTGSEESPDTQRQDHEWNPSTCLDDALLVINKVSRRWQLDTWEGTLTQRYSAGTYDENGEEQYGAQGDSAAIVLCLTALRSVGVPESLITQAMEEK